MTALKEHKYIRTFLTDVLKSRYEIKNKEKKVLSDRMLLQILTLILLSVNLVLVLWASDIETARNSLVAGCKATQFYISYISTEFPFFRILLLIRRKISDVITSRIRLVSAYRINSLVTKVL